MGQIKTSVPSTKLRPGTYAEMDVTSGAKGLVPIARNVALVGQRATGVGTATNGVPTQVWSEADGDAFAGAGSELALMIRAALAAARKAGLPPPQLWAVALADPGGGVKATYTITITGPSTASGDLVVQVCGRTIRCAITNGDAQNTIATNLKAAFDKYKSTLPVVAGVAANVVTLTAVNAGANGADIRTPTVVNTPAQPIPAGVTAVAAAGVAASGAVDIQPALDALVDKRYDAMAFATHIAGDLTKAATHIDSVELPQTKNWSFAYFAEYGSVSTVTTLSTGGDKKEIVVVACRDFPNLPGEVAAAMATTVESVDDPAVPFDRVELDLFPCPLTSVYTDSEVETLLAAGATPLVLNAAQTQARIVRLVTTLTTVGGATFLNCLDLPVVRSLFYGMTQIDNALKVAFFGGQAGQGTKATARTRNQVRSVVLRVMRSLEAAEIWQNVDQHLGELIVETDANVPSRFNVAIPASVVPGLHQLVEHYTLFVEAAA